MTRSVAKPLRAAADDDVAVLVARRRFARRQWARRWLAWRRLLAVLLVVGVTAGATWLVLFSSLFTVAKVRVEGAGVLSAAQVRAVAAGTIGGPLATVDLGDVAARVQDLAPVEKATVSRSWPDTVLIRLRERKPVAVVARNGAVQGMDREGVLFGAYSAPPPGLPVVRTGPGTGSAALAEAATLLAVLPGDLARRTEFVSVATVDSISLRLRDGRSVLWGSADDSASKADVLAALLRAAPKARTYDVSAPGQPTTSG